MLLSTPLNAILGFAQLLSMSGLGDEGQEDIERILFAGRHLLGLVNRVLDIDEVERGTLGLDIQPIDAQTVINPCLTALRPLAATYNVRLVAGGSACGGRVRADRKRLRQVLDNLVSNAIQYNQPGGSVTVSCMISQPELADAQPGLRPSETVSSSFGPPDAAANLPAFESAHHATASSGPSAEPRLLITVRDTGQGIPPEKMEFLFAPFERLGAEYSAVDGVGLGLVLTKVLVEAMGGRVTARSVPGQGSAFQVELPVAAEQDSAGQDASMSQGNAGTNLDGVRSRTILCINADPDDMQLLRRLVALRAGLTIKFARDLPDGLEPGARLPDLILFDQQQDKVSAERLLRRLQADPATRHIPVVIISDDATPGQIRRMLLAGARYWLTKPLEVQRFLLMLHEMLDDNGDSLA